MWNDAAVILRAQGSVIKLGENLGGRSVVRLALAELGDHRLGVDATTAGVAALYLTSLEDRVVRHRHRGVAGA